MEEVLVDDLGSQTRESIDGLTIDEQRIVVVKVSAYLWMDTRFPKDRDGVIRPNLTC